MNMTDVVFDQNMSEMLQIHMQIYAQQNIEEHYSKKNADQQISQFLNTDPDMLAKQELGVELLEKYMSGEYYPGKAERISQLNGLNLKELVHDIFTGIATCLHPVLFTSVAAQMAGRLHFSDKAEAITTIAEMLAVLCQTDVFDINKADKQSSLTVISRIPLSKELITLLEESQYLPPMICPPMKLENNYSSGYITHNDSLILGVGNHHQGDICLDVLNLMNNVTLSLNEEFLSSVEEVPTFPLDTQEITDQWNRFKSQSKSFYSLLIKHGNEFHLTHKVDKRGRIYCQGYHITTQGNSYKKAAIELAHKEVVTGVPE